MLDSNFNGINSQNCEVKIDLNYSLTLILLYDKAFHGACISEELLVKSSCEQRQGHKRFCEPRFSKDGLPDSTGHASESAEKCSLMCMKLERAHAQ